MNTLEFETKLEGLSQQHKKEMLATIIAQFSGSFFAFCERYNDKKRWELFSKILDGIISFDFILDFVTLEECDTLFIDDQNDLGVEEVLNSFDCCVFVGEFKEGTTDSISSAFASFFHTVSIENARILNITGYSEDIDTLMSAPFCSEMTRYLSPHFQFIDGEIGREEYMKKMLMLQFHHLEFYVSDHE